MFLASMALHLLLAAPAAHHVPEPVSFAPAFPSIAADQERPSIDELKEMQRFFLSLPKHHVAKQLDDCYQYFSCQPLNAPPDQQWCVYSGLPNNGCLISVFGYCDLCQVCCENCFC